jgi:hypothetical protein
MGEMEYEQREMHLYFGGYIDVLRVPKSNTYEQYAAFQAIKL